MTNEDKYEKHLSAVDHTVSTVLRLLRMSVGELVVVASYITNFFFARFMHFTSQQEEVYNYFNDKKNIFNQVFVKKGWGWTTLAIVVFYGILLGVNKQKASTSTRVNIAKFAILRYIAVTLWWILFTQWCFGLPLMDKIFVWTGGKCTGVDVNQKHVSQFDIANKWQQMIDDEYYESNSISSLACRKLKGKWSGGHDPSGHVFLLIHSSLYLFLEVSHYFPSWSSFKQQVLIFKQQKDAKAFITNNPYIFAGALGGLWHFMLFMTNMYFHLASEKFVGLLFGYVGVVAVYFVPRWISKTEEAAIKSERSD